jgi:tripartite-type tricarboxylate transporter receptor subunit TctC
MTSTRTTGLAPDVPTQVFDQFLEALASAGVSADLVARLRKALLEEKTFTDRALKAAVLSDESLP